MEKIKIELYGVLAEIAGSNAIELINVNDINAVKKELELKYPEVKEYNYFIAVNDKIINENRILKNEDSIAVMPPFSGG